MVDRALTYSEYLALDEVLGAQRPRSDEHDEHLFIVVHQVYELWFKQLIHELGEARRRLEAGDTAGSLHILRRVLTILKVVVAQVDVIETMTPRHFAAFRGRLQAASGFQSAQFRQLEAMLGRRDPSVIEQHPSPVRERLAAAHADPPLFDSLLAYLRRQGFDTTDVHAALLAVYRADDSAAQVCERFVDLDEGLQEWRYRHVKMVERTIGDLPGTGGSPGAAYLRSTLFEPLFPALWAIRPDL